MTAAANKHRQQVRALLERVDPGMLAFVDAARATFGAGVRLTELEVTDEHGQKFDLRKPLPEPTP